MSDKYEQELVNSIEKGINNLCLQEGVVSELLANMHRTLQQKFTDICFAWIKQQAYQYENSDYDDRNQKSCRDCATISEQLGKKIYALSNE